jgi:hypothetical protein
MQFRKIMAEEVAKMTAQLTDELSHAREQLTRACRELEDTRLQLQAMKEAQEAPLVLLFRATVSWTSTVCWRQQSNEGGRLPHWPRCRSKRSTDKD